MVAGVALMFTVAATDADTVPKDQDTVTVAPVETIAPAPEVVEAPPVVAVPEPVETVAPVPTPAETISPVPETPECEDAAVACGPVATWDDGRLICGTNAAPAIDQDRYGNWWAYCEPAMVNDDGTLWQG